MTEEPLWSTVEAAQYLKVSRRMVQKLASRGRLPAVRVGKLFRFKPDVIREWSQKDGHQ